MEFDGQRALAHAVRLDALGSRPSGSPTLRRARDYLVEQVALADWHVLPQDFDDRTASGPAHRHNLLARFPRQTPGRAPAPPPPMARDALVLLAHYDTPPASVAPLPAASDAAAAPALLLEAARVLALDPRLARRTELVFADGHHPRAQFSASDGLAGARHYASVLRDNRGAQRIRLAIALGALGLPSYPAVIPPETPKMVCATLFASARFLGSQREIDWGTRPLWDAHLPLIGAGVPTVLLSQADHEAIGTADDTIARIDPHKLVIFGRLLVHLLRSAEPAP